MESKRLPNEQSLEELLKTLEDTKDESIVGVTDDVFSFISTFNILPGKETVLKKSVYDLYKSWSKDPVSNYAFSLKMTKHFKCHMKGPRHYYELSLNSFQIEKETLSLLEKRTTDKTKFPNWQKHFESFLNYYNISKGKTWVQSHVLAHFYDMWCFKNKKRNLLSEINFFNFCKIYFEYKRNSESRMMWFGLNEEFVQANISQQKLIHLQQAREKKYGKKQKIKYKIPGFKTRAKSKIKIRTN
jgi:hypothetical protein